MMDDMLSYAIEVGTGKRAHLGNWPIAGKTGTTQNNRDAVFVGYSARLLTGVWLGNDDGSPTNGVGGGSLPVNIWSDFMGRAHQNMAVAGLPGSFSRFASNANQSQPQPNNDRPDTIVDLINGWFNSE